MMQCNINNNVPQSSKGKTAHYKELRDFALNETPLTNPKAMLKELELKELISVYSSNIDSVQGQRVNWERIPK